jgi:hypothetical protein
MHVSPHQGASAVIIPNGEEKSPDGFVGAEARWMGSGGRGNVGSIQLVARVY